MMRFGVGLIAKQTWQPRSRTIATKHANCARLCGHLPLVNFAILLSLTATSTAQSPITAVLEKKLASHTNLWWQDTPVRDAITRLAQANQVAIWLDRRIDPSFPLTATIRNQTLQEALHGTLTRHHWGLSVLPSTLYVGPASSADKLATIYEIQKAKAQRVSTSHRRQLLTKRPIHWPAFQTPRNIALEIARSRNLKLQSIERIPHDLWPEQSLPATDAVEQLTLVLAGFDLTIDVQQNGEVKIIGSPPTPPRIRKRYQVTRPKVAAMKLRFPQYDLADRGNTVTLTGRVEEHRELQHWIEHGDRRAAAPIESVPISRKRLSIAVREEQLVRVLNVLEQETGITIDWQADPALQQRRVSFEIQNATLQQFLERAFENLPIRFQVSNRTVTVKPAAP